MDRSNLEPGAPFRLDLDKTPGDQIRAPLPHPEILKALEVGTDLLLDDGKLRLRVTKTDPTFAETEVVTGGPLSERKGVNVPNVVLPLSSLTAKDRKGPGLCLVPWLRLDRTKFCSDTRRRG